LEEGLEVRGPLIEVVNFLVCRAWTRKAFGSLRMPLDPTRPRMEREVEGKEER